MLGTSQPPWYLRASERNEQMKRKEVDNEDNRGEEERVIDLDGGMK
jgi:hypothetical protein